MNQITQLARAAVLSFTLAASAQAIPLSTLLAGGTLSAGGLAFTNFSASYSASDPSRLFDAANIDVTATPGASPLGAGLRFTVRNGELTVQGDGTLTFVDLRMGFRVAARDPALAAGALLTMASNGIDMRDADHGVYVADRMADRVVDRVNGSPGGAGFVSEPALWIGKELMVWATDHADTVALIVFSQQFDLEVPEPGSLPLLAVAGLAAAAVLGKKRRAPGSEAGSGALR